MPNRIKEETDDVIILDSDKSNLFIVGIVILIFIWALPSIKLSNFSDSWLGFLFIAILTGLGINKILYELQVIIISSKSQSVAIQYSEEPFKEIPFSNIERIEIKRQDSEELDGSMRINIITIQGGSIKIYDNNIRDNSDVLDARRIAEKISKIINIKRKSATVYSR